MLTIRVDAKELDRRRREIRELITNLDDRREVLEEIKKEQVERWVQNFESQGGEYEPWAPSAEGGPALHVTGRTFSVFTDQAERGNVNAASVRWDFRNTFGAGTPPNQAPYGQIVSFQEGYTLGNSEIPARTLADMDEEDEERIANTIEEFVSRLMYEAFG